MAAEFTEEQKNEILNRLAEPFHPNEVQWRVAETDPNNQYRGRVAAYADIRTYNRRMNSLFSVSGWDCKYAVTTQTGLTRMRHGKAYPTGKILVTGTVVIPGIGCKESTGEAWADDDNALTRAQAQAKKRALSEFGLGAYFYDLDVLGQELWVRLDGAGRPTTTPKLPEFALPYAMRTGNSGPQPVEEPASGEQQKTTESPKAELMVISRQGEVLTPDRQTFEKRQSTQPPLTGAVPRFTTEDEYMAALHAYGNILGMMLVENILRQYAARRSRGEIKGEKFDVLHRWFETAVSLLGKVRAAVGLEPDKAARILEHYGVDSVDNFLTCDALRKVAEDLGVEVPAVQRAAA